MADSAAVVQDSSNTPPESLRSGGGGADAGQEVSKDCVWKNDDVVFAAVRSEGEGASLRVLLSRIRAVPVPELDPATASAGAYGQEQHRADSASESEEEEEDGHSAAATASDADSNPSPFSAAFDRSATTALRFLRARDGDLEAALQMWTDSLNWRVSSQISANCRAWAKELAEGRTYAARTVRSFWYGGHLGVDKRGVPVNLVRVGRGDPGGLVREVGIDRFIWQYVISLEAGFERLRTMSEERGELVLGFVDIFDMGADHIPHWTARAFSSTSAFKQLAKVLDHNYPERVIRAFVVRAPWIFSMFWKMFEGIIPKATKEKIGLYHSKWTEPLSELVDENEFPPWLLEDGAAENASPNTTADEMTPEEAAAAIAAAETEAETAANQVGGEAAPEQSHDYEVVAGSGGYRHLSVKDFRPNHDIPGGLVPKRTRLEKDSKKAVNQCAQCGRPTIKKKPRKCKSCGSHAFEAYQAPSEKKKENTGGWFSGFWGSRS